MVTTSQFANTFVHVIRVHVCGYRRQHFREV